MLKFRCQHCGQRIAVPARHLGKLVTCAECGRVTHPLAEQIVKAGPARTAAPAAAAPITSAVQANANCGNCGRSIGALQVEHRWQEQKVCASCYHLLTDESSAPAGARAIQTVVSRVPTVVEQPPTPAPLPLRERAMRALMVFVVAVVALYGALTLLRDIAGLIAVAAVAVLALLALYAVFRAKVGARVKPNRNALPSDRTFAASATGT
jgi:hypothetical protein